MLRRTFLEKSIISLGALLVPYSVISDEKITAGNLYINSDSESIPQIELEDLMNKVITHFRNIGVEFKKTKLTRKFPWLENLDLGVFIYDSRYQMNRHDNEKSDGVANANTDLIREEFYIPYENATIKNNCCFVFPNVTKYSSGEENLISKVASVCSHEIGHQFTARHIYDNSQKRTRKARDFIMCPKGYGQEFHPQNATIIREFINLAKNKDYDPNFIMEMRLKSLNNIYLEELVSKDRKGVIVNF